MVKSSQHKKLVKCYVGTSTNYEWRKIVNKNKVDNNILRTFRFCNNHVDSVKK